MHHASGPEAASAWTIGSASILAPLVAVMLVFACALYLRGWYRVRGRAPRLASIRRPVAFAGGLLTVWLAIASPLAAWHEPMLVVHMVQHLLLSALAAPLVLLGAPSLPMLYGLPRAAVRLMRTRIARDCCYALAEPLVCWSVAVFAFVIWHVPAVFEIGMSSPAWRLVEQTSFFASGLMFWWPIVQPWPSAPRWPRWSLPLYLFVATLPCDAISAFLAFSERVLYPASLAAPQFGGWSALADQECAGALMWVVVTVAYGVPAAAIAYGLLRSDKISVTTGSSRSRPLAHDPTTFTEDRAVTGVDHERRIDGTTRNDGRVARSGRGPLGGLA